MNDNRTPFKNLGQLSKKTAGTFRWATGRVDFGPMIDAFAVELRRQLVLTYFIPPGAIVGKKVKLVCKSPFCGSEPLESNERRAPDPACGGNACALAEACIHEACVPIPISSGTAGGVAWIGILAAVGIGGGSIFFIARKRKQ